MLGKLDHSPEDQNVTGHLKETGSKSYFRMEKKRRITISILTQMIIHDTLLLFNIAMEAMAHSYLLKAWWIFPWQTVSHNQMVSHVFFNRLVHGKIYTKTCFLQLNFQSSQVYPNRWFTWVYRS